MKQYSITIEGMGCAHCVKSVTEGLTNLGAKVESCAVGSAKIAFDGDEAAIKEAVEDRGFTVKSIEAV